MTHDPQPTTSPVDEIGDTSSTSASSGRRHICLVTIHGVGFQQAPKPHEHPPIPGYADMLHEHLATHLDAAELGDDPQRKRSKRGENGPVYVQSTWPPESYNVERGLARLGHWEAKPGGVDNTGQELTAGDKPIAHVALVYSHLEDQEPRLGSLAQVTVDALGAIAHGQYVSAAGLVRMLFTDFHATPDHPALATGGATPSLRVRADAVSQHTWTRRGQGAEAPSPQPSNTVLTTVRQLERDVAAYVCRNELRERVRGFVRDALLRLIFRRDLDGIVVNAHSQGTVLAFDVLRDLPPYLAPKVLAFVTAGSPLRKYVDAFNWGYEVSNVHGIPWINFWDAKDPVADRLTPPREWRPGMSPDRGAKKWKGKTLFEWVNPDTGDVSPVTVDDKLVDNLKYSIGGGLQAHNYWDNDRDVVGPLADLLRRLARTGKGAEALVGVAPTPAGGVPAVGAS